MVTIIDTNVVIEAERGRFDIRSVARTWGDLYISVITASELLHGVGRARDHARREVRRQFVEGFLADIPIVAFDEEAARIHSRIWVAIEEAGTPVGPHDLIIAASALALGAKVATLNVREFSRIPGISLIDLGR